MSKPTLAQLAQIAEVVAATAVVISLVNVGAELRSNTAAVRAAALQAVSQQSAQAMQTLAADSAMSHIRHVGDRDPAVLTEEEAYRYFAWYRGYWMSMQNVFVQHELGLFDPSVWSGYVDVICSGLRSPGVRTGWKDHRDALDAAFVLVVERCPTF